MKLQVSLVIPVRNEERSLRVLLESIRAQTRPPDEVILVDGGSNDRTVELARELTAGDPRYRVIEAGDATPGRGRNVGIAAATHDWIALTDAGIRLDPDWLAELEAATYRQPSAKVVYGHVEPVMETFFERCAALSYVDPVRLRPEGLTRCPSTASLLIHRDVWRAVGGFPDLRAAEDLIFFEAIARRDCPGVRAPRGVVHWRLQPTLMRTFAKFTNYSRVNVLAGQQRQWHYGVARLYVAAGLLAVLAALHTRWWLVTLALAGLWRVGKRIWEGRQGLSKWSLVNPFLFAGVAIILLTLDLATFVGWGLAVFGRRRPGSAGR